MKSQPSSPKRGQKLPKPSISTGPLPSLEEKLRIAVETLDLETLQNLHDIVVQNKDAAVRQENGQMTPRIDVYRTPGMLDAMGVDPLASAEEGWGMDVANRIVDGMRWVQFVRDKARRPEKPVIVAEGDSWFLHPLLEDTLDWLRQTDFNVRSLAAAGDTVANMLADNHWFDILKQEGAHAFLFSGGGNDFLGDGKVDLLVLKEDKTLPADKLVDMQRVDALLDQIVAAYERMLGLVRSSMPWVKVFSHGYDYVEAVDKGPWIWPYLSGKGYSKARAVEVVKVLLDRFNERFMAVAAKYSNFRFIDMRGVVGTALTSWDDAIHPENPGFKKVADKFAKEINSFLSGGAGVTGGYPISATEAIISRAATRTTPYGPATVRFVAPFPGAHAAQSHRAVNLAYRKTSESLAIPGYTTFEDVRRLANELPPESEWRPMDEVTRRHIRAVAKLLQQAPEGDNTETMMRRVEILGSDFEAWHLNATDDLNLRSLDAAAGSDTLAAQVTEALFGESELEPVRILLRGYQAGQAVGRVRIIDKNGRERGSGSGFLVGPGLFLTNHHVLGDPETAASSIIILNEEKPLDGSFPTPKAFRITQDIYLASPSLDFAFVSVAQSSTDGANLSDYGFLKLIEDSGKAVTFEQVSIIQHPKGEPKQIAIRNSFVMGRDEEEGIYYTTDTLGGSSGSPVLNRQWEVVALHHRFVPHPVIPDGVLANRGVRISSIFERLRDIARGGSPVARRILELLGSFLSGTPGGESILARSPADLAVIENLGGGFVDSGFHQGLTEAAFLASIGREESRQESDIDLPLALSESLFTEALSTDPDEVLRRIGPEGYRLIIEFEVSSKAWYEKKLHRPIKPGGASGITIGIGYDLGYHSEAEFQSNWGDLLPAQTLARLAKAIGKTNASAASLLSGLQDISISYDHAIEVFRRSTLPKYFSQLNRHIPDIVLSQLAPPCVGALVSLTFNRGPSFQKAGDRYREMRGIREALISGRPTEVPSLIRSMKRIWQGDPSVKGLLRRRDREAELFEMGLGGGVAFGGDAIPKGIVVKEEFLDSADSQMEPCPKPDLDEKSEILIPVPVFTETQIGRLGPDDVKWVSNHANNPDYSHLPPASANMTFDLTSERITEAIRLGFYQPVISDSGCIIVAIRGAAIASGAAKVEDANLIKLREQKPDHRTFRCVICVYQPSLGRISAYLGSTVPNRGGVASCANLLNGLGGTLANLLPTGCYEHCVGTHYGSATIPTVLRLGKGPEPADALEVTTLRTANDGIYGTRDLWDRCTPADNIHPAFAAASANFSSLGCLTIQGRYSSSGGHSGLWADFRKKAGFDGNQHRGKRYDVLLTTGMELAAIQLGGTDLRRLAHGSQGSEVTALQTALGAPSADGEFGPATKKRLVEREQVDRQGVTTGIYSMPTQTALGFGVF